MVIVVFVIVSRRQIGCLIRSVGDGEEEPAADSQTVSRVGNKHLLPALSSGYTIVDGRADEMKKIHGPRICFADLLGWISLAMFSKNIRSLIKKRV